MWLKVAIVVLFIALIASLSSSFWFLVKDPSGKRRTWNALSVRLLLAALLMGLLVYGIHSGQLGSKAPWDAYRATPAQEAPR